MALEGTYEYECMRAELLGVDKPDYEEFMKNKAEKEAKRREELEAAAMTEEQAQQESFHHVSGKLDELNNILKSTQKKINRFTAPLSKLLPFKASSFQFGDSSSESPKSTPAEIELDPNLHNKEAEESVTVETMNDDDDTRPDNNTPVLDNLIDKFERNHASMEYQRKQMKRFMK